MAQVPGIRRLFSGPNGMMLAALSAALIVLVSSAVVGARNAETSATAEQLTDTSDGGAADLPDYSDLVDTDGDGDFELPESTAGPNPAGGTGGGGTGSGTVGGGGSTSTPGGGGAAPPSQPGATRVGVFNDHFEYGLHAPLTLNGAPLNLAEDPVTGIKGYITDINKNDGGINGRKIRMFLEDDRYTTQGGAQSRDKLVKEVKPFFISGTLGVDQIAVVSKAAGEAKIPYMAVGGPEPEWVNQGMFQVGSSYDQYASLLAEFICKHGEAYVGGEVRLATTTLDSPYILPVEKRFVKKLSDGGCVKTPVDAQARGKIQKPDQQSTYQDQILKMKAAYGGEGANLVVPLQDPVSTSRQVAELRGHAPYKPKWTFNNFAHDGDTTLALMGGDWNGFRGMSGNCYYHPDGNANAYKPSLCNQMKSAHEIWAKLGPVTYDQNAGGCVGGKCDFNYNEDSWRADGQGGSSGYQLIYFWYGAMKAIGSDPTREKFVAALRSYDNYSNLLTSPITFNGSNNIMRGAGGGVVIEAQSNLKYKQVLSITPGVVSKF